MGFVVSFLQHAVFEQFSTTEEEDLKILRDKQIIKRGGKFGLDEIKQLTHGMEMAIRFRARRRSVLCRAIASIKQLMEEKSPTDSTEKNSI